MSTLEDAIKVADRQQFRTGGSNARFRDEFIRKSLQNPGNFYRTYGTDLKAMDSGQVTTTQPMEQTPSLPSTQTIPSSFTDVNLTSGDTSRSDGGGYSYGESSSPSGTKSSGIGSGGVFGNSPSGGQVLGTLAGLAGAGRASGVVGQALSGTPQSMEAAARNAAIGYGISKANLGKWGGVAGLGINAAISGKAPSMENVFTTLAMMNPATAPFGLAYNLYSALKGWRDDVNKQQTLQDIYGNPNFGGYSSAGFGSAQEAAAHNAEDTDQNSPLGLGGPSDVSGTYGGMSEVGYTDPSGGMDAGGYTSGGGWSSGGYGSDDGNGTGAADSNSSEQDGADSAGYGW